MSADIPPSWRNVPIVAVLLISGASLITGCGSPRPRGEGLAPGTEEARSLVESSLKAWRDAGSAPSKADGPAIRFVDPDLDQGAKLVSYTIGAGEERREGPVVAVPVELRLLDASGKTRDVRARYQVATQPRPAVVRDDPD